MLKKILLLLNLFFASALVFVHFSAYLNPLTYWPFAFLGLGYPILLCANLLFLGFWLFKKSKRPIFISLFALLCTWTSNSSTFQLSSFGNNKNELSILSWNVKNFDLYNWSGNKEAREKMFALIEDNRPSILCLQEFYTEDKGKFDNLNDLKTRLGYEHFYFAKTYSLDNKRHWGLIIFSDYVITNTGKLTFKEGTNLNSCMYADIALDAQQIVRVYNLHLQSNQFSEEDYEYLENIGEAESDLKSAEKILAKLKKGYINRAKQTNQVLESKASAPYPVIICGDFNDTPVSYAYKTMSKGMKDAFIEKGIGFSKTFDNPTPFLRIDYTLFNPMFQITKYNRVQESLSDHFPIIVHFNY